MPDPRYDILIQNQYANTLKLVAQLGGQYIGLQFELTPNPVSWSLSLGRYQGIYAGNQVDIHGYWIFRTDGPHQCWQVMYRGNGPLTYWNADGLAGGNPEDFELFAFDQVDRNAQTVKIHNAAFFDYARYASGHVPDPNTARYYVGLTGATFNCNETINNAAIFKVEF